MCAGCAATARRWSSSYSSALPGAGRREHVRKGPAKDGERVLVGPLLQHGPPYAPAERLGRPVSADIDSGSDARQNPLGAGQLEPRDDLLNRLGEIDPQLRSVVEMRVFEGLTVAEVSQRTGSSERSVARCWAFARDWLATELSPGRGD